MIIGIDLGTTNSLVGVYKNDGVELIPNVFNEFLTPSVVGLDDKGHVIVGKTAQQRLITHPDKTTANFKRYMGSDHTVAFGKRSFRPEELSALVLRSLKADAEEYLGEPVVEAVITVPAYFNDSQRKATRAAGELAGLKVERLLNEPTAAGLAYGLHTKEEQRYLVFDMGGGTFDISVVEFFDNVLEVHASAGDNFLGGNDFTEAIYVEMVKQLATDLGLEKGKPNKQLKELLWKNADALKYQLTRDNIAKVSIPWNEQLHPIELTQEQFEHIVSDQLNRVAQPVKRALRDAKIKVSDLGEIVLVGGATRMPVVRRLASRLFQRFPASDVDPDQVVAVGAAIQAGLKAKHQALDDTVMTDVCPYTLGVEVAEGSFGSYQGGLFLPIIERNSLIPTSREESVCTLADNQTELKVNVYQGESPHIKNNIFLGTLKVKVPKGAAGEQTATIRFTYDVDGLLEVEVTVDSIQKQYRTTIEQNPGVLSADEIKTRVKKLEKLKVHPRSKHRNQHIIARAERAYQELLGDERAALAQMLSQFRAVLETQDERLIREMRAEFEKVLDHYDNDYLL
jgi:molecular chaperone HscC